MLDFVYIITLTHDIMKQQKRQSNNPQWLSYMTA